MKNIELRDFYTRIDRNNEISYGGNQGWFSNKTMKEYGCGAIGAADIMLYLLHRQNPAKSRSLSWFPFEETAYRDYVTSWKKRYFPIFPKAGISGWMLSSGLRRIFRKYRLPYKVRWGVRVGQIYSAIEEMLEADIPVLFSVGPNFPLLWGKYGVPLYRKEREGLYVKSQEIHAHYMVITGIKEGKIRVSSWGKEYYMIWEEYRNYLERHSCALFTNVCYIRPKKEK